MSALAFRSDIQALRAIVVIAVMAFHFDPAWLPGGFIRADLFLVISGYLITSILLHKKERADYSLKDALKYFYLSRLKRIAPAYYVMLVIVAFVAAVFFLPRNFSTFKKGLEKAVLFNSPMRNEKFAQLALGTTAGLDRDHQRTNQILKKLKLASNQTSYLALDKSDIFKRATMWKGHLIYNDEHHQN